MTDMICRKTMMRCQTPGMCSPFGGCNASLLVEANVRYAGDTAAMTDKPEVVAKTYIEYAYKSKITRVRPLKAIEGTPAGAQLIRLTDHEAIVVKWAEEVAGLLEEQGSDFRKVQQLEAARAADKARIAELEGLLKRVHQSDALAHSCPLWRAIDAALAQQGKESKT